MRAKTWLLQARRRQQHNNAATTSNNNGSFLKQVFAFTDESASTHPLRHLTQEQRKARRDERIKAGIYLKTNFQFLDWEEMNKAPKSWKYLFGAATLFIGGVTGCMYRC